MAETLGLKALAFLAAAAEPLERFIVMSGAAELSLRERAADPALLCAVLDFLLTDDDVLVEFCNGEALSPEAVHRAALALGG
jgi:hypothetical protein